MAGWQVGLAQGCSAATEGEHVGEERLALEEGRASGALRMQLGVDEAPVDVDLGGRGILRGEEREGR